MTTYFTFLDVVIAKLEDQKWMLMETFLKMNGRMVLAIPWTAEFDANSMQTTQALVWIELPMVHPVFEYYSNQLLAKVGKVIYPQTATTHNKFSYIRGCVMCNLNEDLVEYIVVRI